jgi:hypothetical protein
VSQERAKKGSSIRSVAKECAGLALDLGRVLLVLPAIERARRRGSAGSVLSAMRMRGSRAPARGARSQARLARAIGWVDRLGPGGPNCLRRTLLRVALDPTAAKEDVVLGLNVSEARRASRTRGAPSETSGHAWVGDAEPAGRYEVEFRV